MSVKRTNGHFKFVTLSRWHLSSGQHLLRGNVFSGIIFQLCNWRNTVIKRTKSVLAFQFAFAFSFTLTCTFSWLTFTPPLYNRYSQHHRDLKGVPTIYSNLPDASGLETDECPCVVRLLQSSLGSRWLDGHRA